MHHHDEKCKGGVFTWLCLILVIIGGLNWGTIGVFNFNWLYAIFHTVPWLERIVYIIIGLGAIGTIIAWIRWCSCKSHCKHIEGEGACRCGEGHCKVHCADPTHKHNGSNTPPQV
jgi:uncharacterized protein